MIPLLKLEMYQRRLRQMVEELHDAYPDAEGDVAADMSGDLVETVRNTQTALAHLDAWVTCRKQNRHDPDRRG